jgi:adenylate cyclase
MERNTATDPRSHGYILALLVIALLAGLPIAVWLDLRNLSDAALHRPAADLNSVITSMRGYYASNVVGRVLASPGSTQVAHNYQSISGAPESCSVCRGPGFPGIGTVSQSSRF